MTHMNNIFVRKGGNIKKTAQIDDWSCGLGDEDQTEWGQTRNGCLQPSDRTSEDLSISLQLLLYETGERRRWFLTYSFPLA